jgi:hypothetical protein
MEGRADRRAEQELRDTAARPAAKTDGEPEPAFATGTTTGGN